VILADLMLNNELEGSSLPNTCNKMEGAQKVSEHDHSHLLDEISRMDILYFVEDEDDIMDCLGSKIEQFRDDAESSDSESLES
jgi:hypothetical protein